ncbi:MAG TPA: cation diffusion facilitator family transporter [Pseudonocardiaceae bacterium]|nr:cation diffusion facilitator family transporter [Pseudonocardiaceae bacterium]
MGDHGHGHGHGHGAGPSDRRRLGWALAITSVVLLVEVVGTALTGSLALLADAGHLATDVLGLAVALIATVLAQRPPSQMRTYGLGRAEVLAAALNALVLLVVAGVVAVEAVTRLSAPPTVPGVPLLVLGALGLVGNLAALAVLTRGGSGANGSRERSLNLRGAMLEVMGDALGSVAVLGAALVMLTTGWRQADPVASLVIAALIVPRALALLREAAHVLLEGVPRGVDAAEVHRVLCAVPGVRDVHDLHLWTITAGRHAVSAHLVVDEARSLHCGDASVLDAATLELSQHFGLTHSTLQIEHDDHASHEHTC